MMNKKEVNELKRELNELEETMYETKQFHTLDEKVEDMKRRGINPNESYKNWDDTEASQDE